MAPGAMFLIIDFEGKAKSQPMGVRGGFRASITTSYDNELFSLPRFFTLPDGRFKNRKQGI